VIRHEPKTLRDVLDKLMREWILIAHEPKTLRDVLDKLMREWILIMRVIK